MYLRYYILQIRQRTSLFSTDSVEERSLLTAPGDDNLSKVFIFVNQKHTTLMVIIKETRKTYLAPSLRIIDTTLEVSFLQSNLEPIGGGDDPDIEW